MTTADHSHPDNVQHRDGRLRELSQDECWSLLSEHQVGRISYVDVDGPVILPLNYLAADGSIWVRTASYNQLAVHLTGQRVAFEVDQVDARTHSGWSVLVRGRAEHAVHSAAPGLEGWPSAAPWPDGQRTMLFRIVPTEISGRLLRQADVSPDSGRGPGTIQRHDHPSSPEPT